MRISEIKKVFRILFKENQKQSFVPFLMGVPGIGKTAIVHQFAKEIDVDPENVIDLRLSQLDSCDIRGIPRVENGISIWAPPEFLPFKGSKFEGKRTILFLDEFNRASTEVLQSVFQLIYDRRVGMHQLLDDCLIIAAGNHGFEDNCDVNELDAALKNRLMIMKVEINADDWLKWAKDNVESVIYNFIKKNLTYLRYDKGDGEWLTPRTWEQFSKAIQQNDGDVIHVTNTIGSVVLGAATGAFLSFIKEIKTYSALDVLDRYNKKEFSKIERDKVHALNANLIAYLQENKVNKKQLKNFYNYASDVLSDDNAISFFQELADRNNNENIIDFTTRFGEDYPEFDKKLKEIIYDGLIGKSK